MISNMANADKEFATKETSMLLSDRVDGADLGYVSNLVRNILLSHGYIEVFTPVLRADDSVVNPRFSVIGNNGRARYLRDCMELPLRKYISDQRPKVFEIGPCFRQGEDDATHSEAFYMMELYSLDQSLDAMLLLTASIIEAVLGCRVTKKIISMKGVIQEEFDLDITSASTESLVSGITEKYPRLAAEAGYKVVNRYIDLKEPELFTEDDVLYFLTDYPLCTIDSAKRVENENRIFRFEAFYNGKEIAHAFVDSMDSYDLQKRIEPGETMDPEKEELITLTKNGRLCPTVGLGIGIDRLALLLKEKSND